MLPCCIIAGLTIGTISAALIIGRKLILKLQGKSLSATPWKRPTREV